VLRRTVRPALALLAGAVLAAGTAASLAGAADSKIGAGPPYNYKTEIMTNDVLPLRNAAKITRTKHGYRYRAGGQDGHLVLKRRNGKLRFVDTGTAELKRLPNACRRLKVRGGIGAACRIPGSITQRRPLLVEVWPRLGHDFLDGSTLPATFALTMLADEGRDVARFGAGPDFFNGHSGVDRISGGAGSDWIRAGRDNDVVKGGPGRDDLIGMGNRDRMYGGDGDDRMLGMEGSDMLQGDAGEDMLLCGSGRDRGVSDGDDYAYKTCENL
jgi:Ca2+-binding RTX toxin-like protein